LNDCRLIADRFIETGDPEFEKRGLVTKLPNGLKRLETRLTKNAAYPSFPAYLRANFDAFSKTIGVGGPDKWEEIAAWAYEERLSGGKEIKGSGAKSAYDREKRRRAKLVKAPAKPAVKPLPQQSAAEAEPPSPAPSRDARARFQEQFKRAIIRKKPEE